MRTKQDSSFPNHSMPFISIHYVLCDLCPVELTTGLVEDDLQDDAVIFLLSRLIPSFFAITIKNNFRKAESIIPVFYGSLNK